MFVIESSSHAPGAAKKFYKITPGDWSSWGVGLKQERLCIPDTILAFESLPAYFARLGLPAHLVDGVLYVEATWAQICAIQKAMCSGSKHTSFWTQAA
jgi:hypothetical protein